MVKEACLGFISFICNKQNQNSMTSHYFLIQQQQQKRVTNKFLLLHKKVKFRVFKGIAISIFL